MAPNVCYVAEYMAPELINCLVAGPGADLWSVGVLAFTLLTGGRSPFDSGCRSTLDIQFLHFDTGS